MMTLRFRARGGHDKAYYGTLDIAPNGSVSAPFKLSTLISCNGTLDTIQDLSTLNYERRKSSGEVIMSPVTQKSDIRHSLPVNWVFGTHPFWGARQCYGDVAAVCAGNGVPVLPGYISDSGIVSLESYTLQKALSRVAPATMQSLVSVVEARKTAAMLYRPFGSAALLLSRMVNRRATLISAGMNFAAASTQAFLEYRFGWKPTMFDFKNACEAHVVHDQVRNLRLVARASEDRMWTQTGRIYTSSLNGGITVTSRANYKRMVKVAAGYLYEIRDDNTNSSLQRALGLRFADMPANGWELVPFSFVVDRFVDIGQWLRAIVPKPGVYLRGSWTTSKVLDTNEHSVMSAKLTVNAMNGVPTTTYERGGGSYSEVIRTKTRKPNPSIPVLPSVNTDDLSILQHLDHAALLAQILGTFDTPALRKQDTLSRENPALRGWWRTVR